MGIFKKSVSSKSNRSAITIIAEGNKLSGEMNIIGKMHIDGVFEGNIKSLDNISIGATGHVSGIIKAKHMTVSGLLEGEIVCDELHIERGGRVRATVLSKLMSIDPAGCFEGERRQNEAPAYPAIKIPEFESGVDAIDSLPDKITLTSSDKKTI
ncbi:bactofilin family protein [Neptunomonas antarctica]|uniref:Protein CcmA, bactofilin family n=1 Tax=Neptunomonas antarctica TaxID=619304 RepID=A0A1N7NPG2_9GAMM|nr:polymer-forming cytoskeletal protein [Neptunomonas antarctica]SIT00295.1 protein CcmA, bactofilin family [Neptunomonas antarctica]